MKTSRFLRHAVFAALLFAVGCVYHSRRPDPLAGWQFSSLMNLKSNEAIKRDYQDYIRELPTDERTAAGPVDYFENPAGEHAVLLWIGVKGKVWRHILIYDEHDKRIRTIKYISGNYQC